MSYRVTASLVLVKVPGHGDDYRIDYHYGGSIIPWLSEEQEKHFLDEGLVEKVDGDDGKPAKVAPKDAWVKWAVAQGASFEEAEASTKPDLIELYG